LKSEENIDTRTTTMQQMNSTFEQKKKEIKELIPYQDIVEADVASGFSDLAHDKPAYYSSSLFSTLQYEDLKKAHVESVIPVTQEDYEMIPKYNNVNDYKAQRDRVNTNPLSKEESESYLLQKKRDLDQQSTALAFKYAQESERVKQQQKGFWADIKQITGI
jgi:hypothetical protein